MISTVPQLSFRRHSQTVDPSDSPGLAGKAMFAVLRSTETETCPWTLQRSLVLGKRRDCSRSDFCQPLVRVSELLQMDAELVEHRQVEAAHLAVRVFEVVEYPPGFNLTAGASEYCHR